MWQVRIYLDSSIRLWTKWLLWYIYTLVGRDTRHNRSSIDRSATLVVFQCCLLLRTWSRSSSGFTLTCTALLIVNPQQLDPAVSFPVFKTHFDNIGYNFASLRLSNCNFILKSPGCIFHLNATLQTCCLSISLCQLRLWRCLLKYLPSKVQLQVSVAKPQFIVVSLSQIAVSTLLQPHEFPSTPFPHSAQLAVEHNLHVWTKSGGFLFTLIWLCNSLLTNRALHY